MLPFNRKYVACFALFASTWVAMYGQDALPFEVLVPPGGINALGASAGLPVQEGDLMLSTVQGPTNMFASLINEDAEMIWVEQTPFRGFYMKPWGPGEFVWFDYSLRKWTVVDHELNVLDTLTGTFESDDDYHDVHRFDPKRPALALSWPDLRARRARKGAASSHFLSQPQISPCSAA